MSFWSKQKKPPYCGQEKGDKGTKKVIITIHYLTMTAELSSHDHCNCLSKCQTNISHGGAYRSMPHSTPVLPGKFISKK